MNKRYIVIISVGAAVALIGVLALLRGVEVLGFASIT